MTPTTQNTPAAAEIKTCGHELNRETVHSGSRADDGSWIVDPYQCANCKKELCDECTDDCKSCSQCSEYICPDCEPTARQRRVTGWKLDRTDYLCAPCCARQDAAREKLERFIYRAARQSIEGFLKTMGSIESDARQAIEGAEQEYAGRYPEQSGYLSANLRCIANIAKIEQRYSDTALGHCTLDYIAGDSAWLDEVVNELEEAIRTAKRDADL